jgi:hypothetical protein
MLPHRAAAQIPLIVLGLAMAFAGELAKPQTRVGF